MAKAKEAAETPNTPEKKPTEIITVDERILKEEEALKKNNSSERVDTSKLFEDATDRNKKLSSKNQDNHLNVKFEDATDRGAVVEEKGRDMSVINGIGDATGRDSVFTPQKYKPTKKTALEKIYHKTGMHMGWDTLLQFSNHFGVVSNPKSSEEETGQSYVEMKAILKELESVPNAKAFVDSHTREGRLLAAAKGVLGAIEDLGDMVDNQRVPNILALLITKDYTQVGAKRQKTALQSFSKYMRNSSPHVFKKESDLYIRTMVEVMSKARDESSRFLAFEGLTEFNKQGKFTEDQTGELMHGFKSLLCYGPHGLDQKAASFIVEALSLENVKNQDDYEANIQSKIKRDVTKESVLMILAKHEPFTEVCLEKNIQKAKFVRGGMLKRTLEEGLSATTKFFKNNQDIIAKTKITVGDIYKKAIPTIVNDNKILRDDIEDATKDIQKHWDEAKKDVLNVDQATQDVAKGIDFEKKKKGPEVE